MRAFCDSLALDVTSFSLPNFGNTCIRPFLLLQCDTKHKTGSVCWRASPRGFSYELALCGLDSMMRPREADSQYAVMIVVRSSMADEKGQEDLDGS